jgi:hypothetical protein
LQAAQEAGGPEGIVGYLQKQAVANPGPFGRGRKYHLIIIDEAAFAKESFGNQICVLR